MIILHEGLEKEASYAYDALQRTFGINCNIKEDRLFSFFPPIPEFDGYSSYSYDAKQYLKEKYGNNRFLIITGKDFYFGKTDKEEEWVFGFSDGNLSLVSVVRLRGNDSTPQSQLIISEETYEARIRFMSVHEVGHGLITIGAHYKKAYWVNVKKGFQVPLEDHCTENTCTMYQTLDIIVPPAEVGYLLLGEEKRYDSGLDETIARLTPGGLCAGCRSNIHLPATWQ